MIHSNREMVVKCPHCAEPHPYTEVIFSTENDEGWWELDCRSCGDRFVVPVTNPGESGAAYFIAGQNEGFGAQQLRVLKLQVFFPRLVASV
jgi:ribosomal protein S27E